MPRRCPECGSKNIGQDPRDTRFFCRNCGNKWEEPVHTFEGQKAQIKGTDEIVEVTEVVNEMTVEIDRAGITERIGKDQLDPPSNKFDNR